MVHLKFRGIGVLVSTAVVFFVTTVGTVQGETTGKEKINLKGAPGMGLTVEPGGFILENIKPGEKVDIFEKTKLSLVIYNRSDAYHTYKLRAGTPSEAGIQGWVKGYSPIPDGKWFELEKEIIRIPPHSKAYVKMFVNIPDEDKYYNQKWVVGVAVEGVPEPGEKLALAVHPSYYIETLAKEDVSEKPAGILGLVPGAKTLEGLSAGVHKQVVKLTVFNNDTRTHTYRVYSFLPEETSGDRITVSPGYEWIEKTSWLRPGRKKIVVNAGESSDVYVTIVIPKREKYKNKKLEGIIFVEDEEGGANFSRIKFTVAK